MSTDERILEAALRVFMEEGLRGATTRRIAQEAGVNEVTLFRRFGTKEGLLIAAMKRDAQVSAPQLPDPSDDPECDLTAWMHATARRLIRFRGLIRATMEQFEGNPELCQRTHEGPARIREHLTGWFAGLRDQGKAHGTWHPESVARLLMGGIFGEIMRPDAPLDPDLSALDWQLDEFARLVLAAIRAGNDETRELS